MPKTKVEGNRRTKHIWINIFDQMNDWSRDTNTKASELIEVESSTGIR